MQNLTLNIIVFVISYISMDSTEKTHAIPQNIMSVEFKLIGDLSLKQFVFIAIPLVLGFLMYIVHVNNYITLVFTAFLLLIAFFIDFVPIDDRPLDDLIINFLVAIKNPTQRVWRKNPEFPEILRIPKVLTPQEKKDPEISTFLYQSPMSSNLGNSANTNTSNFLDQREKTLIENIDKLNNSMNTPSQGNNTMVSPSLNNPAQGQNSPVNNESNQNMGNINPAQGQNPPANNEPNPNMGNINPVQGQNPPVNNVPNSNMGNINPVQGQNPPVNNVPNPNMGNINPAQGQNPPVNNVSSDLLHQEDPLNFYKQPINTASVSKNSDISLDTKSPITSNVTDSLNSDSGNESMGINLNNDSIPTSYDSFNHKNDSVNTNPDPIPTSSPQNSTVIASGGDTQKEEDINLLLDRIKKLEIENKKLQQNEPTLNTGNNININAVEDAKPETVIPNSNTPSSGVNSTTDGGNSISQPTSNNISSQNKLSKEDILKYLPDFVKNPNIVSGVIMKKTGDILPDAVIIIKDSSQKPVRAIKTNQLGQFFVRTPLQSGEYNLEIAYQGLIFDPISIELNDSVKEPMLIYSKA
jgi:hypothetical protein